MRHLSLACALVLGAFVGTSLAAPETAEAAARVSISNAANGQAQADINHSSELQLRGSGFQSIANAHGGVYVFFGTTSGGWRPSQGGQTGRDYFYVPDSESRDNQGFQRFVAFPGSDTAGAANGGELAADGSWSTTIRVPGPTFQASDRSGNVREIDCRQVQCGIITIGAHGVTNPNNETFTPVEFTDVYGDEGPADEGSGSGSEQGSSGQTGSSGETGTTTDDETTDDDEDDEAERTGIVVDLDTAVAGRVLSFTSDTFEPGEQVIAVLDDGVSAAGPFTAGADGRVAGLIDLPIDLAAGTHTLKLSGASSLRELETTFPVRAADDAVPVAAEASSTPEWLPYLFLGLTAGVFLLTLVFAVVRIRRSRRVVNVVEGA